MRSSSHHRQQRGAALLLMMLVVLVAATAVLVTRLNIDEAKARQQVDAQHILAEARQALLDYALLNPDMSPGEPARLPCPDINGGGGWLEGEAHSGACGATGETVMGRLPWRTLGMTPPRDAGGACLWYVVSGSHKDADTAGAAMLNDDSSGQLQLWGIEAGRVIAGATPEDRAAAFIVAPMPALGTQNRSAPATGEQCSSSFVASDFLDVDGVSGISNATLAGAVDVIDILAVAAGFDASHNDRVAAISQADIAAIMTGRHDYLAQMRSLGLAVGACIANYASSNPGGANDRRMPWPAPMRLSDYRIDAQYDDADIGFLAGRLPDDVDDSNTATGNAIARVLSDCDPVAVPEWTPEMLALWRNWKDHFFYAVGESYEPSAPVPSTCTTCPTVNAAGPYAAVVLFSGTRLAALGQTRTAPPIDADSKDDSGNYLEGGNAGNVPYVAGAVDFTSQAASGTFNDLLFCIDPALSVSEC